MTNFTITSPYTAIMGMGKTGMTVAHFLIKQGVRVYLMDNRMQPPELAHLPQKCPNTPYIVGRFDEYILANAQEIVISPGISTAESALIQAKAKNIPIISEIEVFARHVNAPVIAITGSNGKSTVTTLVGEMAKQAGWNVRVGGNLGTPALELLCHPAPDLYVLELSSFQLETTVSLNAKAAVILNITEDHMDRYRDFAEYQATKQRVFQGDGLIVINADDPAVVAILPPDRPHVSFSLDCERATYSVCHHQHALYFLRSDDKESTWLCPVSIMRLQGAMMRANALAALALGEAVGLPLSAMIETLQTFAGLPHRCVWVARKNGADWFNDSKGTNVGATIAAIQGLEKSGQIILIAGGEGKDADFSPLKDIVAQHLKACILIGRDAPIIAAALAETVPLYYAATMQAAVEQSAQLVTTNDAVLLSPACASFDMFNNYAHRGDVFTELVLKMR